MKYEPIPAAQERHFAACNWCGYRFARKAAGVIDGRDVVKHKQHCRPDSHEVKRAKRHAASGSSRDTERTPE